MTKEEIAAKVKPIAAKYLCEDEDYGKVFDQDNQIEKRAVIETEKQILSRLESQQFYLKMHLHFRFLSILEFIEESLKEYFLMPGKFEITTYQRENGC